MLLDNKNDYSDNPNTKCSHIISVVDFIRKYTGFDSNRRGKLDVVTGFFTIAGLNLLYKELSPENEYRLVLSELTGDDDFMTRVINLLQGDAGVESSLMLSQAAKNAIEFLRRETVCVKVITHAFCHAKAYIYQDNDDDTHDYYVMGSSNLTESGLGMRESSNIELNFAQTGSTNSEYIQLRRWFSKQWENVAQTDLVINTNGQGSEKIDAKEYFIHKIEECFGRVLTPEEVYYKILFELFIEEIDFEGEFANQKEMALLQDSTIYRTLFDYQKKGVISLIKMLRKWNGAILADAVGLGKTFSALAVMKYFQNNGYNVLMLCPKKLEQNWKQYRKRNGSRFDRDEFDYIIRFHTDLQGDRFDTYEDGVTLDWLKRQQKLLVVIDESHNLRNDKSSRYEMLLNELLVQNDTDKIRDIKVLLLSATPINNSLKDVRNQFKLIAKGDDSAFNTEDFGIRSLQDLFLDANKQFGYWCAKEGRTISDFIDMLQPDFFNLTDRLIVARTRNMIEKTLGENLGFPKKVEPNNIYVGLKSLGKFNSIAEIFDAMNSFKLIAYQPSQFMEEKTTKKNRNWQDNRFRETYLVRMMSILFMKRLESSWFSCMNTIKKVRDVHESTLQKVESYLKREGVSNIELEVLDTCDIEDDDYTLRDDSIDLSKMVRINEFYDELKSDLSALNDFYQNFEKFNDKFNSGIITDDKLEKLIQILKEKQYKNNKKAIVFTTFGDTAEYLYSNINKRYPQWRVACITGQNVYFSHQCNSKKKLSNFILALQRFAPRSKLYNELDWSDLYEQAELKSQFYDSSTRKWNVTYEKWLEIISDNDEETKAIIDSEIDIIIATDCLSEGQNLQDSDCVINYDIHWNPVRLIQRFGRIDRIGSPNNFVHAINFWPTTDYNEYLNLTNRVNYRMAMMRLVGTETQTTDKELENMIKDDPLIDRNTQKLLSQIADANIDEIEQNSIDGNGDNLGLQDLSMEIFRQDLIDYFEKNKEMFKKMPSGVFSGFKLEQNLFESVPESLVAVFGYPRRTIENYKKPYKKMFLMLHPAGANSPEWKELSPCAILNLLRKNKKSDTFLPDWIKKTDSNMVQKLSDIIEKWMEYKTPKAITNEILNTLTGQIKNVKKEPKIEDIFNKENVDLVVWEYISR